MSSQLRDPAQIVFHRAYPLVVARLYIPSHQGDGPVSLATLHNWRKAKKFAAIYRPAGRRKLWFIRGADIIALIGVQPATSPAKRSGRARASSLESLRDEGFKHV